MARIPVCRTLALLLVLTLTAPLAPAGAAPHPRLAAPGLERDGLGAGGSEWSGGLLWQSLAANLPYFGRPLSVWLQGGCGLDPDGRPLCGPKVTADRGCGIDPDGKPLCGPTTVVTDTDRGCGIDPNGQPLCQGH